MPLLNPYSILWIVVWSMVLFVVAPHLDVVCKPAARTLRIGSFGAILHPIATVALMLMRGGSLFELIGPIGALGTALFWGSFALAAWQLVQSAPKKGEFR